jgi:DnaK suppressor protein
MVNLLATDLRTALLAAREQHKTAHDRFTKEEAEERERSYADAESDYDELGLGGTSLSARFDLSTFARIASGMVEQIDRALRKLDDGTYGRCDGCGNQIESERLEALPTTWRCSSCAQRSERASHRCHSDGRTAPHCSRRRTHRSRRRGSHCHPITRAIGAAHLRSSWQAKGALDTERV